MKPNNLSKKDDVAIQLKNINKSYKLYPSLLHQAMDVFGISNPFSKKENKKKYKEFKALDNISLTIKSGERVGIIGRNGAGKTTLLKLITGNFTPTSGEALINGKIQALMQVGFGFHPEFSGYENIKSSLVYNGLSKDDFENALKDIIDFVELGDFLHQPVKTYSLGMMSRLQFATATAINPDILIVDEIMGAGDAYFTGKSSARMEKLAYSGATLLLVSHSMQQVLQFCTRAIWIEAGRIVMDAETVAVVKKYEEYIQHITRESENTNQILDPNGFRSTLPTWVREKILTDLLSKASKMNDIETVGGISRWPVIKGLKISNVRVINHHGVESRVVYTHNPLEIELEIIAEESKLFFYVAVIVLFTKDGRYLCRHCSEPYKIKLNENEKSIVKLVYPENKLGNGEYIFSAALYKELDLKNLNAAKAYDLLSRSFEIKVEDRLVEDATLFHHPALWATEEVKIC